MPIQSFDFAEESNLETKAVENAHRIVGVGGGHDQVSRVGDRLEVPWRNKSTHTYDCEVLGSHGWDS
jgi:hypothetical protein